MKNALFRLVLSLLVSARAVAAFASSPDGTAPLSARQSASGCHAGLGQLLFLRRQSQGRWLDFDNGAKQERRQVHLLPHRRRS